MSAFPDLKKVKEDILEYLRQDRSYESMDELIGCSRGTYKRWEQSKLGISWNLLIDAIEKCGIVLNLKTINGYKGSNLKDVVPLLNYMMRGMTQDEFCQRTGTSRATLNRWLAQESEPTAEQFLNLFGRMRQYLFPFLVKHFETTKFRQTSEWFTLMTSNANLYRKHEHVDFIRVAGLYAPFTDKAKLVSDLANKFDLPIDRVGSLVDDLFERKVWQVEDGKVIEGEFYRLPHLPSGGHKLNIDGIKKFVEAFLKTLSPENLKKEKIRVHRTLKTVGPVQFRKCHRIIHGAFQEIDDVLSKMEKELPAKKEETDGSATKYRNMAVLLTVQNMGESLATRAMAAPDNGED